MRKEVEEIIRRHLSSPDIGFFTITAVTVSPDLKNARIGISVIGSPREQQQSFDSIVAEKNYIQHKLAGRLPMKHLPRIEFVYGEKDDFRVEELLEEIKRERNGKDVEGEA